MYINKKFRHGVRTTYIKKGCRCPECRSANSAYLKKYRMKASTRPIDTPVYEFQKISRMALDWVIYNRPDIYEQLKQGLANG